MSKEAFAGVEWTIDDLMENAEQFEINISRDFARRLLESNETYIIDAMVEAGWKVIEDALRKVENGK